MGGGSTVMKVSGLQSLGLAIQLSGDTSKSQQVLEQSLAIANQLNAKPYLSSILLNLGKTAADLGDPSAAIQYFDQAEQVATSPSEQLQARLDQFKLFLSYNKLDLAASAAPQLFQQLRELPPAAPPSMQPSTLPQPSIVCKTPLKFCHSKTWPS